MKKETIVLGLRSGKNMNFPFESEEKFEALKKVIFEGDPEEFIDVSEITQGIKGDALIRRGQIDLIFRAQPQNIAVPRLVKPQ